MIFFENEGSQMSDMASKFVQTSFDYSVFDVANYFLAIEKNKLQEQITHLKLQKLVYYAQGASLAFYKRRLFSEEIQAWLHGPVCPKLYECFKHTKELPNLIGNEREKALILIRQDNDSNHVLTGVWKAFGNYSGSRLENMTHQETPWLEAIRHGRNTVITPESMYNYFVQFLPGENI